MRSQADLKQLQSLPLELKIKATQRRIREWYEHWEGNVYVSRSGGKDSDVLGHIVKEMYPNVPQVFVNTGLEFDSVREHAMEECDVVLKPHKSFLQVLTEYGYPAISKEVSEAVYEVRKYGLASRIGQYRMRRFNGEDVRNGKKSPYNMKRWKFLLDAPFKMSSQCCNVMKKSPAKNYAKRYKYKPINGTMASESRLRNSQWIRNGCNGFEMKSPVSNPLSFWTEQDILHYIKKYNLKIADAYGEVVYTDEDGGIYDNPLLADEMQLCTTGCKRTGCVFCMFGITQDTDRFLKLKELEPQKYDYVMRGGKFDDEGMWIPDKGLGYKFVIDWLNENGNLNIKY